MGVDGDIYIIGLEDVASTHVHGNASTRRRRFSFASEWPFSMAFPYSLSASEMSFFTPLPFS